jgi:hypothetical protein
MIQPLYIPVTATDLSGQKRIRYRRAARAATMQSLVQDLVPRLHLPEADSVGRSLTYHARVERLGRHAHASEIVGSVLEPEDHLSLHPSIQAG